MTTISTYEGCTILKESLTIAAVQTPLRSESIAPLEAARVAERMMRDAAKEVNELRGTSSNENQNQIDLFILPELAPLGYSEYTFSEFLMSSTMSDIDLLVQIQKDIESVFVKVARDLNAFVSYGAVTIKSDYDDIKQRIDDVNIDHAFKISQVVLNPEGEQLSRYDKIHLCNYGDCAETRFFNPGTIDNICSFKCREFNVGIIICADIRDPMLCRSLAGSKHNVDLILQPAAFSRDLSFRTWKSFAETRAVENSVYFCGINYSGENYGESIFIRPWVDEENEPKILGIDSSVLIGKVERNYLDKIRNEMPFHKRLLNK